MKINGYQVVCEGLGMTAGTAIGGAIGTGILGSLLGAGWGALSYDAKINKLHRLISITKDSATKRALQDKLDQLEAGGRGGSALRAAGKGAAIGAGIGAIHGGIQGHKTGKEIDAMNKMWNVNGFRNI